MKKHFKTKIFLDSADPEETKAAVRMLGFLDGQTTNPTLISRNPLVKRRLEAGKKFTQKEALSAYRDAVVEIAGLIPNGSVSVEVPADKNTSTAEMLRQAMGMFLWAPNLHIKLPITDSGLSAAKYASLSRIRVNMTLCFSQDQAAAVHAATFDSNIRAGDVFISPFVGRLDDQGLNGMDLVKNIVEMYHNGGSRVQVVAASIRDLESLLGAIYVGADIVTAPYRVLKKWTETGMKLPDRYPRKDDMLRPISYKEIAINQYYCLFDISHKLTDVGLARFAEDWNGLVG